MKSFLSGRPQASVTPLHTLAEKSPPEARARLAAHSHGNASGGSPQIECIKQGDKVVRIVVTCACGERIEIECLYPAGG